MITQKEEPGTAHLTASRRVPVVGADARPRRDGDWMPAPSGERGRKAVTIR